MQLAALPEDGEYVARAKVEQVLASVSQNVEDARDKLEKVTEETEEATAIVQDSVKAEPTTWQGPPKVARDSIETAARDALRFSEETHFSEDEVVEAVTLAAMTAAANRPFAITASGALIAREVFAGRKAMQELVEVRLEAESLKASVAASKVDYEI